MFRNIVENACEGTDPERVMHWNSYLMRAVLLCGETNMASGLARYLIPELAKGPDEVLSRYIAGQSHAAMTSSLTK